jgi:hypothetical protein
MQLGVSVPADLQEKTADTLIDLILNSQNASKLSSNLARSILSHWQSDQLATEMGLSVLLEASFEIEPQKTLQTCTEFGLSKVAEVLSKRAQP